MSKIVELSDILANQIAAGEVVERPASVVKELVENAIDANSTQIDIYLEEAGLRKIQVIDNGDGIEPDDVLNAFKRHATSKIITRDDLFRIKTLGFRGEALPSIASVSEITLETSTGENEGSFVKLSGGQIIETKPNALRKGTKLKVENLFFNTPARLKYVKTLQTELANVGDIVNRLAMSHPYIAFRLVHDGNKMLATTGNGDIRQTIAGIYGMSTAKKMLEISGEDLDFKVSGYISLPELTRASRNYLSIIINGRYIKNHLLNKAIVEGYGSKLMIGRFPLAVIQIDMDPLLVDVNVHPTKQEVRLSKENELMDLISHTIQSVLSEKQLIPRADLEQTFKKKLPKETKLEQIKIPLGTIDAEDKLSDEMVSLKETKTKNAPTTIKGSSLAYDATEGKFYIPSIESEDRYSDSMVEKNHRLKHIEPVVEEPRVSLQSSQSFDSLIAQDPAGEPITETEITSPHLSGRPDEGLDQVRLVDLDHVDDTLFNYPFGLEYSDSSLVEEDSEVGQRQRFPELEYFGQMHGTYLFAQSSEGLYIIDQHAAQERIKYEYFRKKIGEVSSDLQEMLVPLVLDYPKTDWLKIQEQSELLSQLGINLEPFGQTSFICRSHPTWYPAGQEDSIIKEMIETVIDSGKLSVAKFREDTAIMMSCKQSIKANHHLDTMQARQLLLDLAKCDNPFNCPHGRPVLIHFDNKDMEKMFKRIQDSH
ncbi:DNA mismatch repair endonuclease MutL [Vagococcus intermedius]|uniref:DNA mismatch repair protein MutL n=1 Tax=Vagococcus intermedius TaxID=2991418 RepID=A0AAF0CUZ2_9ENTE|nr:DNA mismatch repair endonuclease MutL [Vagococcus intermedius]WEG73434.1 DNA mismatch repair endonuclease MutL [Vagococcus intermedius]WEG75517.1 DNA mismatch repair endonuclease MutL [Vagococcus intermedius]